MEDAFLQIGLGGVVALLVLKEVFNFLTRKKNGDSAELQILRKLCSISAGIEERLRTTETEVHELREAHLGPNALDNDGAPKWYVRQSLTDAVVKLTDVIEGLGSLLKDLHSEMKDIRHAVSTTRKWGLTPPSDSAYEDS